MKSSEIRRQFIDFFASKGHACVPSSPVLPLNDPTLMFANAGMNQFKPIFLGAERATHPRVANSQKCIRAGGKHNDLDDVGQDTYHHTFFEMLGNWSFGDYFKKEAIEWAWELLTKVWGIDKTRLHATYFGGLRKGTEGRRDEGTKEWELEPDHDARDLWLSVTDIDPSHVHPGNMKDNFWEMGETGPCGPCSEIHIDLTPDKSGRDLVNKGDARVMELWNLVFIQFNRGSDGKLTPLPARHVDTGMGFERLCAILQKKTSNYDTDVFTPLFDAIQRRTGAAGYRGTLPEQGTQRSSLHEGGTLGSPLHDGGTQRSSLREGGSEGDQGQRESLPSPHLMIDVSYRVIADHLRCLTFALTDGAIPSNEGRGYVLRRILRRAVRYGRQYLNMHEPFLCDLVPTVVEHMSDVFPELRAAHRGKNVEHVANLIREEEESFLKTLDRGIHLFNDARARASERFEESADPVLKARIVGHIKTTTYQPDPSALAYWSGEIVWRSFPGSDRPTISGTDAFRLHDTYGFPVDLTELMAEEQGLKVDIGEYERLMEEARDRARGSDASVADGADDEREAQLARRHAENHEQIVNQVISDPSLRERILRGECPDEFKYDDWREHKTYIVAISGFVGASPTEPVQWNKDEHIQVSTATTCFYAEQGGQEYDRGIITTPTGAIQIDRVTRRKVKLLGRAWEVIAHCGVVTKGPIRSGDACEMGVSEDHRVPTMQNHTATHVLNWALREVLCPAEERENPHVQQKGSLVDPDKTRFDFSHNHALSGEELSRIESLVKKQIGENLEVHDLLDGKREVPQPKAREINTLRAVFGEKYPDLVRVVSIGPGIKELLADPKNAKWMQYSVEFCGGTHVKNSREIGDFVLVHEEAVAKGVRRVVGLTGETAARARQRGESLLEIADDLRREVRSSKFEVRKGSETYDLSRLLREVADADKPIPILTRHRLADTIALLQESAKEDQKKSAAKAQRGAVEAVGDLLAAHATDVNGVTVVVGEVPGASADALRSGIDFVRNKKGSSAVLLAAVDDGKVTLVAGMSRDLVERGLKAGDLIKEICPLVGGKGGGRPDMAQGGGNDPNGLSKALEKAAEWIAAKLPT